MAEGHQAHAREADKTFCDLCDNVVETLMSKCVECNVHMCKPCTKAHSRVRLTKKHTIIAGQLGPLPTSRDKSICTSHPGEDVRYYCYTCKLLICSLCITSNHSNHKCSPIKLASGELSDNLSQTLARFKDSNIAKLNLKINKIKKLEEENETHSIFAVKNIKIRIQELTSEINKIGENLIQESENSKQQNKKHLKQMRDSMEKKLSEMEGIYKEYNTVLTSGSDIDKIIVNNESRERLDKFKSDDQEVIVHLSGFTLGKIDSASLQTNFGVIDELQAMVLETDHTNVTEYQSEDPSESTDNDKMEDKELKFGLHGVTELPAGLAISSDIKVNVISTFNHKSLTVRSICPVKDNTALIHCSGEYKNDIVNCEGQVQTTVKLDFVVCDFDLSPDGIIATDTGTNIHKLTMDGHHTGVISTAPLYPVCLCISSDGNILITLCDQWSLEVNYDSRRCVARMTISGQTVDTYEYNNGKRLFTLPWGISENINGDICVVNSTSHTTGHLVILDVKGRLKVIYTGGQMNMDEQFDPYRVKCDRLGHIIVTDCNNMKVHLLRSDGQLVQYLMTDKDLQYNPISLAIDKQGLLWVGCYDGQAYVVKYLKQ